MNAWREQDFSLNSRGKSSVCLKTVSLHFFHFFLLWMNVHVSEYWLFTQRSRCCPLTERRPSSHDLCLLCACSRLALVRATDGEGVHQGWYCFFFSFSWRHSDSFTSQRKIEKDKSSERWVKEFICQSLTSKGEKQWHHALIFLSNLHIVALFFCFWLEQQL